MISGGGGKDLEKKKEKKSLLKMWSEKKFVVEIGEKYVDQKNRQMVTYIIGKAYDKNIYFSSSTKFEKKIVGRSSQKNKMVFVRR